MDGLRAGRLCRLDDPVTAQVAFGDGCRPDVYGLVGHFDVQRADVGVGMDGDGGNPQPARGADDPAGNLAAVCDQDFREHRASLCARPIATRDVDCYRSASGSRAPSSTKAPAKERRIHAITRGREMTWLRTAAANTPYPTKITKVIAMKVSDISSIVPSARGAVGSTNCGRKARKKIDSFGLRMLTRIPRPTT